jgi:hypothetical protein
MGYLLSDSEREALFTDPEPHPAPWEPPEVRLARLEAALRGMLALSTVDRGAMMLQAVAADALGDREAHERIMQRLRGVR